MQRTSVGLILTLTILVAPLAAAAQPLAKVPRIGLLAFGSPGPQQVLVEAFRQGLRDLGYAEGQNVAIEYRFAEERQERLLELAAELVRLQVDVIVAPSNAAYAAKHITPTIPIVMTTSGDPVATGIIASLARPGGNMTGLTLLSPELAGKRLELLKEVVPELSRVAVLWNAAHPDKALEWRETQIAAQALGVQLQSLPVRGPEDFDSAFEATAREHAGALLVLGDSLTFGHRTRIVDLAAKSRLPAMYEVREFAAAGGFVTYGPSVPDNWRRAATFVDKILKGSKPGDLPVERPMRFELVINLQTAKALDLTIPPRLLFQATEVIQ